MTLNTLKFASRLFFSAFFVRSISAIFPTRRSRSDKQEVVLIFVSIFEVFGVSFRCPVTLGIVRSIRNQQEASPIPYRRH